MPNEVFGLSGAVWRAPQIHVSIEAAAVGETQCYDVTKPESFVVRVIGRTLILPTWIQASLFIPNYGTAVPL